MDEIKWSEIRKKLYSPEELAVADRLIELHRLYDGIVALQQELAAQHHDAEIGCLDYKVVKALAATYELQDFLSECIASTGEPKLHSKLKEVYENVYPGWWPILDKYIPQMLAIDPECDFIVKEKLGTLRIWAFSENHNWQEFQELQDAAEKESAAVCEICGNEGHIREDQAWIQTLCDRCAAMEHDERHRTGQFVAAKLLEEIDAGRT